MTIGADWVSLGVTLLMAALTAYTSWIITRLRLDIAERMAKTDQRIARIEGRLSISAAE